MSCGDGTWRTKQDILRDLAQFTGLREVDIPEEYIVRGNRAPRQPRIDHDEEAEFQIQQLMCGRGSGDGMLVQSNSMNGPPDIAGIQDMLRMVRDLEDEKQEEKVRTRKRQKENTEVDIPEKPTFVISKLNPNVKEFVPRSVQSNTNVAEPNDQNSNKIDITVDEKVQKENELKNRIRQSSKTDTMVAKRDRNAAIAALMKLKATEILPEASVNTRTKSPSLIETNSNMALPEQPILYPPEYFQTVLKNDSELKLLNSTKENIRKGNVTEDIKKECVREDVKEEITPATTPKRPAKKSDTLDPLVQESIKKVESWLEPPKKPERVYPDFSPITFKRKQCSTPSTASETKPEPTSVIPRFVPTSLADELIKKYTEKAKAKEAQSQDIWTKLENDLKKKDKEIKQRMQKEQLTSSDGSGNESPKP